MTGRKDRPERAARLGARPSLLLWSSALEPAPVRQAGWAAGWYRKRPAQPAD